MIDRWRHESVLGLGLGLGLPGGDMKVELPGGVPDSERSTRAERMHIREPTWATSLVVMAHAVMPWWPVMTSACKYIGVISCVRSNEMKFELQVLIMRVAWRIFPRNREHE